MIEAIIAIVLTVIVLAVIAAFVVPRVRDRRRLDGQTYYDHSYHEIPH